MRRPLLAAVLLALVVLETSATAGARHASPSCTGAALTGRFAVIPGSAGAGNIVYALVLRNRSTRMCQVTGLPSVTLLGRTGRALPTHVRAAFPNGLTAVLVRLAPGHSARATARFSPDVPGTGEQMSGPCEPKAYKVTVHAPGGGKAVVPVVPATPVCEHGQLQFSAYQLVH